MSKTTDRIRAIVLEKYVRPKLTAGEGKFAVRVRDVLTDVSAEGFPRGQTPLICAVLQGKKFVREAGLEIESVEGPPSKQSPTVVVNYRVVNGANKGASTLPPSETPAERAFRLTEKIRGLLKEEITSRGGTEAFLRWVRSDDEQAA